MRTGLRVTLLTLALTLAGALAAADAAQCPALIKRAQAEIEALPQPTAQGPGIHREGQVKVIRGRLEAARVAHGAGRHDEAVKLATEALEMLDFVRREGRVRTSVPSR
jgi:hypothetical protein